MSKRARADVVDDVDVDVDDEHALPQSVLDDTLAAVAAMPVAPAPASHVESESEGDDDVDGDDVSGSDDDDVDVETELRSSEAPARGEMAGMLLRASFSRYRFSPWPPTGEEVVARLHHMLKCKNDACVTLKCRHARVVRAHFRKNGCDKVRCPDCIFVRAALVRGSPLMEESALNKCCDVVGRMQQLESLFRQTTRELAFDPLNDELKIARDDLAGAIGALDRSFEKAYCDINSVYRIEFMRREAVLAARRKKAKTETEAVAE